MKYLRFALLCCAIGVAIALQPRTAAAQCTERCLGIKDEGGGWQGFSCVFGSEGHDCQATYSTCQITCTNCGCATDLLLEPVLDADGMPAGVTERCRLTGRVMDMKSVVSPRLGATLQRSPEVVKQNATAPAPAWSASHDEAPQRK